MSIDTRPEFQIRPEGETPRGSNTPDSTDNKPKVKLSGNIAEYLGKEETECYRAIPNPILRDHEFSRLLRHTVVRAKQKGYSTILAVKAFKEFYPIAVAPEHVPSVAIKYIQDTEKPRRTVVYRRDLSISPDPVQPTSTPFISRVVERLPFLRVR